MLYLITDTETVGLNPPEAPASGVVEVAALSIDPVTLEIKNEFYSRVNPGCEIHPKASEVHGIYAEDVINEKSLKEVFNPTEAAINIGHNSSFDVRFLSSSYDNLAGQLCTLALARLYIKDSPNHKLSTLVDFLGLPKGKAHSALADVHMTHALLRYLVDIAGRDLETLVAAARKPKQIHHMPFGKFKGQHMNNIPMWYVDWLIQQPELDKDLAYSLAQVRKLNS